MEYEVGHREWDIQGVGHTRNGIYKSDLRGTYEEWET